MERKGDPEIQTLPIHLSIEISHDPSDDVNSDQLVAALEFEVSPSYLEKGKERGIQDICSQFTPGKVNFT
jgi:hypothetical protein